MKIRITGSRPGKSLGWLCIQGAGEWVGTEICFGLSEGDREELARAHPEMAGQIARQQPFVSATVLDFRHQRWREASPMFAECSYTRGRFLRSLKRYCETGSGTPWPEQHRI